MSFFAIGQLLLATSIGLASMGAGWTEAAAGSGEVVASVFTQPAAISDLKAITTGFGKVQSRPADVVSVTAPHDGIVSKVYVRMGEIVQKGGAVAGLTTAAATQAAYRQAQTAADFADAKLKRLEYLWSKRVITRQILDQAEIAAKDAQATLEAQKNIGAQTQQETLKAPTSGTVTAVSVSEGDRIQQNAKMLTLAPSNALAVLLGVEPEDVDSVRTGMAVTLTPAFNPNTTYSGKVSAVNAMIDPQTRLVDVLVDLDEVRDNPQPIGAYMRAEIALNQVKALAVPRQAILYDKKGAHLFVVRSGRAQRVAVQTAAEADGKVAVTGNLQAGDAVVVQGNYELTDGMKVEQEDHEVR